MAADTVQDILLRIGITGDKSVDELRKKNTELLKSVLDNQKEIDNLSKSTKELSKAEGDNSEAIAQNILKQKELQAANKVNQNQINQNISLIGSEMGSLVEKRSQLSNMTLEYTRMSEAEKADIEIGGRLQKSIKYLSDELKAEEKQIGQTQRNVGNYTDSIIEANKATGFGNTVVGRSIEMFSEFKAKAQEASEKSHALAVSQGKVAEGSKVASGGMSTLNGSMKMLAANPLMAIIAVAAGIFLLLKEAIGKNAQIMDNLKVAMAPVTQLFGTLLGWLGKIIEVATGAFAKAMTVISSLFGDAGKSAIAYQNALQQLDDIEDKMLNKKIQDKNLQEEINKLYEASNDRTKTAIERKTALTSAIEKEKIMAKENADLQVSFIRANIVDMKEQYGIKGKLLEKDNSLTREALDKLSKEDKDKLTGMVNQYQDYYNKKSELDKDSSKKISLLNNTITDEEKSEIEKRKKANEDFQKKKIEIQQKTQDILAGLIKDNQKREEQQLFLSYDREYKANKGNKELQAALNQKYDEDKKIIAKKYSDENLKKQTDAAQKEIELKLAAIKKGSDEELALKKELMAIQMNLELDQIGITEETKKLIREKYRKVEADETEAYNKEVKQKLIADQQLEFQNKIAQMQLDGQSTLQVELENETTRGAALQAKDFETQALFVAAKLDSANKIKDINEKIVQNEAATREAQLQIAQLYHNGLSSLLEIFGANAEENAGFAKALAIFQIGIDTATGISKAISAGAGLVFPANLGAILMGVTSVLAGIASAKKALSSAGAAPKAPKPQSFSTGGSVFGPGSGTSDSIPAYLSNGESVNNSLSSAMFAPLYSALNRAGGGAPIQSVNKSAEVYGEQFLANAFAQALKEMPSPVVAVEEIVRVNNRVKVIESMSRQ